MQYPFPPFADREINGVAILSLVTVNTHWSNWHKYQLHSTLQFLELLELIISECIKNSNAMPVYFLENI